jgi:putative ABC transport system permease protein
MSAATDALREAGAAIDPALPFSGQPSLATAIEFQIAGRRIISSVLGGLAAMGLLMAAVGLSGLVAETVVDRKREFAVRLALGAGARRVLLAVLRRAVVLAALGTAAGLALSLVLAGAIRNQLFGVMALEPSVYLSAAAALAVVVLLASLAPAVRAARTNPADVLRAE